MAKKLLANPVVQFLIGRAFGGYLRLVGATTRWTVVNRSAIEPFWRPDGGGVIPCIWHGRLALFYKVWSFKPGVPKPTVLISQSREGAIITQAAHVIGSDVIRGSANKKSQRKGGVSALRAMARVVSDGGAVCLTPDGPTGPRMRAKPGPLQLAKLTDAPLIPFAWATSSRVVFHKSWDQFILPFPFGRGALVWGDPIAPPTDAADVDRVQLALETEMNRIAAEADRIVGVAPIVPDTATAQSDAEPAAT